MRLPLRGWVRYEHYRRGQLIHKGEGPNLVTQAGKNLAAQVLLSNSGNAPAITQFIYTLGMGDSGEAPALDQVALQGTELFIPRLTLAPVRDANILSYFGIATNAGAMVHVREWGLFTALSGGTMIARMIPNEFSFANNDSLNFTWSLEIG